MFGLEPNAGIFIFMLKILIEHYMDYVLSFPLTDLDIEKLKDLEKFYSGKLEREPKRGEFIKYGKFGYLLLPGNDKAIVIKVGNNWDIGLSVKQKREHGI